MSRTLTGSLKQQIIDANTGDYEWVRRNFQLDVGTGLIHVKSPEAGVDPIPSISVVDAAYAKAWSISSAAVGYGFDIVWESGTIASFLTSDKDSCHMWVQALNESIRQFAEDNESDVSDVAVNLDTPIGIKTAGASAHAQVRPPLPPTSGGASAPSAPVTTSIGIGGANSLGNDAAQGFINESQLSAISNHEFSKLPRHEVPPSTGVGSSLIFDQPSPQRNQGQTAGMPSAGGNHIQEKPQYVMSNSAAQSPFTAHNFSISGVSGTSGGPRQVVGASSMGAFEGGDETLLFQLQQKCLRLQAKAERETIDAQVAREQLVKLQTELDQRSVQYSRDMDKALEREKLAVSQAKAELDMKILRATNEVTAHHDVALRAEREQSQRELSCLKEELAAERKRYAALLQKETSSRERAETHEVNMRQEIASLREQTQRLQAEITRLHSVHKADTEHWERERNIIRTDAETQRKRVEREREEFSNKAQVDLRTKLSELSLRFDSRVKEMETTITETIRQQEEGRRLQEMQVTIKQCEKDIETCRTEERRARAREVESLRGAFKERERQTADDLTQLEQLHAERLRRLEQQNDMLLKKVEVAERETEAAKQLAQRGSTEVRLQATQHMQQAEAATQKAESLVIQSTALRKELQESRIREGTYREQLSRALEENRLQRAEFLETQKQLQTVSSEAQMWRKQAQEADMTHTTTGTTIQIARDEINMLEHELARVKEDNYALQMSLHKAEMVVYGSPRSSLDFDSAGRPKKPFVRANMKAGPSYPGKPGNTTKVQRTTFGSASTRRQD